MIIRFDTNAKEIEIISRYEMRVKTQEKIVDVGAKTLPINLGDVFHKALSFSHSSIGTNSVYISNNNILDENNILDNNLYTKCPDWTMDTLKEKAKNNLIDLHFFPVKYKTNHPKKEMAYVEYNLRKSLAVMLEMEQSLQWLVGYNENVQFVVEKRDVEKTLWYVANRLSDDKTIKAKAVGIVLDVFDNCDSKYIASKFQDFWWNVDWFIGKEKYIMNITKYETFEKSGYIGVYVYGAKREDAWRNIIHKYDSSLCLFVDNKTKMMLKRIQKSFNGEKNGFKNYMKEMIGKWFDVDELWDNIKRNVNRIDDSGLGKEFDAGVCKVAVKSYFDEIGSLCYDGELHTPDTAQEMTKEANEFYSNVDIHEDTETSVLTTENESTDEPSINQWTNQPLPKELEGLNEKDFWKTLSNL